MQDLKPGGFFSKWHFNNFKDMPKKGKAAFSHTNVLETLPPNNSSSFQLISFLFLPFRVGIRHKQTRKQQQQQQRIQLVHAASDDICDPGNIPTLAVKFHIFIN